MIGCPAKWFICHKSSYTRRAAPHVTAPTVRARGREQRRKQAGPRCAQLAGGMRAALRLHPSGCARLEGREEVHSLTRDGWQAVRLCRLQEWNAGAHGPHRFLLRRGRRDGW
jgi:hypothetical protein